jgi:hypothetical protein
MIIYLIIILAVISRFVPHMPNFAPITALAIFAAANMEWKKATGIVLAARFISDIFIGFVSWPMIVAIYASHLVGVLFGVWIKRSGGVIPESRLVRRSPPQADEVGVQPRGIRNPVFTILDPGSEAGMTHRRWFKIVASSLGASLVFFLVTNFAFLYAEYPHTWSGILLSYTNGLPFIKGTLFGDLSYTVALFGAYELVVLYKNKLSTKLLWQKEV